MTTPFWFVVLALVAYAIAYYQYGRWYDRKVWKPDPERTTPAHMYLDGVEYFPVTKYVLWGYQFKSVAALGPILGPFIALQFGWLPALAWIILGNFFIGWLQDYGSIMVSVRNQGRSFGPISYEFTGNAGRSTLLGFILFYLLIISATFIYLVALFWNIFPSTFMATVGILLTGLLAGQLMYKARANIMGVTLLSLVLIGGSLVLGMYVPMATNFLGAWTVPFWAAVACAILYLASILPLPTFIQPVNYVSFFPAFLAVVVILIGALLSPVFGIELQQPMWKGFTSPVGPMWPMMFVAIACGAISGWHSLVGSSTTAKQLDIETDAHPVGAGAMLSEGLLALASLAAYMVLAPSETQLGNIGGWVAGAVRLTSPWLGGAAAEAVLNTFFGVVLVIFALTVQSLVTRFWRLVSQEVAGTGRRAVFGQKHVATFIGLLIPWLFAVSGSWNNLWLYFGGANQLLAALALMLITIHLARVKSPTKYTLIPAAFMMITTLAALALQSWFFLQATLSGNTLVRAPLSEIAWAARTLDGIFTAVGVAMLILGIRMAVLTWQSYSRSAQLPTGPAAVAGDD